MTIHTPTPYQFEAFAEMMAVALGDGNPPPLPRMLNEAEARASSRMFWQATMYARITVALWSLRQKRPTKDEMFCLTSLLRSVEGSLEDMVLRPPGDGHSLDSTIDLLTEWTQALLDSDEAVAARARLLERAP